MTPKFQPSSTSQLSQQAYDRLAEISLSDLLAVETQYSFDLDEEVAIADVERDITASTQALINGSITVEEWEETAARRVKDAILLAFLIHIGGVEAWRNRAQPVEMLRTVKDTLVSEYRAIAFNATKIIAGAYTIAQLVQVVNRRAMAFRRSLEKTRWIDAIASGEFNEGKRFLNSDHPCRDCPDYERLEWTPIEEIVPPTIDCLCQGKCRCTVVFRFNADRALQQLTGGTLSDRVTRARQNRLQSEQEWLDSWVNL